MPPQRKHGFDELSIKLPKAPPHNEVEFTENINELNDSNFELSMAASIRPPSISENNSDIHHRHLSH